MKVIGIRVMVWRRREVVRFGICFRLVDGRGKRGIKDDFLVWG